MNSLLVYLFCRLRRHHLMLQIENARLFLKCHECGVESPGWSWDVDTRPPRWGRYLRFKKRLEAA